LGSESRELPLTSPLRSACRFLEAFAEALLEEGLATHELLEAVRRACSEEGSPKAAQHPVDTVMGLAAQLRKVGGGSAAIALSMLGSHELLHNMLVFYIGELMSMYRGELAALAEQLSSTASETASIPISVRLDPASATVMTLGMLAADLFASASKLYSKLCRLEGDLLALSLGGGGSSLQADPKRIESLKRRLSQKLDVKVAPMGPYTFSTLYLDLALSSSLLPQLLVQVAAALLIYSEPVTRGVRFVNVNAKQMVRQMLSSASRLQQLVLPLIGGLHLASFPEGYAAVKAAVDVLLEATEVVRSFRSLLEAAVFDRNRLESLVELTSAEHLKTLALVELVAAGVSFSDASRLVELTYNKALKSGRSFLATLLDLIEESAELPQAVQTAKRRLNLEALTRSSPKTVEDILRSHMEYMERC
jgi:adenylosuccinate lyase